jgi:excinuclease UvrABC nuclease subunit
VRLNKLKTKFYDVLDFEKFSVKAMRTSAYVTTFRVPKMSEFLNKNIEQFKTMMEKELTSKEAMDFEEDEENVDQTEATLQTTIKKGPTQTST